MIFVCTARPSYTRNNVNCSFAVSFRFKYPIIQQSYCGFCYQYSIKLSDQTLFLMEIIRFKFIWPVKRSIYMKCLPIWTRYAQSDCCRGPRNFAIYGCNHEGHISRLWDSSSCRGHCSSWPLNTFMESSNKRNQDSSRVMHNRWNPRFCMIWLWCQITWLPSVYYCTPWQGIQDRKGDRDIVCPPKVEVYSLCKYSWAEINSDHA